MLEQLVVEKMVLNKNKLYAINKYLLWFLTAKDILIDYMNQELTSTKICDFMSFIKLSKNEDIDFLSTSSYNILEIEDDDYKIKFIIDNEFKIEYTIKRSNTNYLFNVLEKDNYTIPSNIIYKQVKDTINEILNKKVYNICKDYILKN